LAEPSIIAMRSKTEHKEIAGDSYRELRVLVEVSKAPNLSQRRLASRLGIALSLTNILLKGLARRGYIRIVRVKWRNWMYVLTPSGIARKVQLTFAYVDSFLDHYRQIRKIINDDLQMLALDSDARVAIYGRTDLGELAFLVLRDLGVSNLDVIDNKPSNDNFLGVQVINLDTVAVANYKKIIVAFPSDMDARCQDLLDVGASSNQIVPLLQNMDLAQTHTDELDRRAVDE